MMKKITLVFLLLTGFMWGQTVRVNVSELINVSNVELLANFGGGFAFYPATDVGGGQWAFDMSGSADAENEYKWRVTFGDNSTQEENLLAKVVGQGIDNDVAIGQDFNTNYSSFCNRRVTIGGGDPPATYFNSFRIVGVTYTELTLTAPAPGAGQNYYILYSVNSFDQFGGPGAVDNGDGTYTAIVRPDVAFDYVWFLNDTPGTAATDTKEDLLACPDDGVTINNDGVNASRIHAAGEDKMDEFSVCPNDGGVDPPQSLYCSTEVFHLNNPLLVNSAINLTIVNTGTNTMKVTVAAADISFLDIIGTPLAGGAATKSANDTSVAGEISTTLTWTTPPTGDVVYQFIQWRKTSTGGDTWQIENATTPFDGVCGPPPGPEEDTSLSDLQLDGFTITGFGSAKATYDIGVVSGDPIPQVTDVTTTNPLAEVGTITQATTVPGSATFDVTSEDTNNVQTYTINFFASTPPTNSPTPPTLGAADVRSIFSDAYTPVTTLVYNPAPQADIPNTYDTIWCPATTVAFPIDGETVNKTTDLGCEGIDFQAGRFDATDFDTVHIDIWTTSATQDKSFNVILSQWNGGVSQAYPLEFSVTNASSPASLPTTNPGTWISLDIPLASFSNYASGVTDIVQAVLVSNMPTIFYDNFYLYKSSALSTKNFEIAGLNVYPNPTQDSWTVKTKNVNISSVQVYDILGKNVLSLSPNASEVKIDATKLSKGLYFATLRTEAGSESLKLIKN